MNHAADAAVANGDQESLVGNGRQPQHTIGRVAQRQAAEIQRRCRRLDRHRIAQHARCLAEQHFDRHVYRFVAEQAVADAQLSIVGQRADSRERAAFPRAQGREGVDLIRADDEHVTLLRLVAPQLQWRHARLIIGNRAQVDPCAAPTVRDRLRHRIGQAAGTDVMNEQDRIRVAECPATIDDFLRAPLHFRVAALH